MQLQEVIIQGVTRLDIQEIFRQTLKALGKRIPENLILFFDTSYLYTFDKSDIWYIGKFNQFMRISHFYVKENNRWILRNPKLAEWHNYLERWHQDQTVNLFDRRIKPFQIERTIDRVTSELMENIANGLAGNGDFFNPMIWHAIGNGAEAGSDPLPSDTALSNEIDRIDVTQDAGGGGVSVDGSTFMCIGNHSISVETADFTETGIFDGPKPTGGDEGEVVVDDRMGDHSIFPQEVSHDQNETAVGSSTIIYQCSA